MTFHRTFPCVALICAMTALLQSAAGQAPDAKPNGNRLTYLDSFCDPYYPGPSFPKLTTPQWVGDANVDAVVTLGIDDMRDVAKYEQYLRPILDRLKEIDGRAAVSIMTCRVDPQHAQLQAWLKEGVSIETHTIDHPCPCLQSNDFEKAANTYHRCVDLMFSIPNNHPVAFRFPCMDSLNTPSPRAYAEILNRTSADGNFLQASTSVTCLFTSADPKLPKSLTIDKQGRERFRRYIPFPSFVNKIENYPYPYLIGKIWEMPCTIPDDWQAQNIQRPNNPQTVIDMVAAIEATFLKQGVANIIFHPHNWIRSDQMVDVIDQVHKMHGTRVKFLTFKECVHRLTNHMLLGEPVRAPADGGDNGVRLLDLNNDGFLDVVIGNQRKRVTRIWNPKQRKWQDQDSPLQFTKADAQGRRVDLGVRLGVLNGKAVALVNNDKQHSLYTFSDSKWTEQVLPESLHSVRPAVAGRDRGVRFRDLDGDGNTELLVANESMLKAFRYDLGQWRDIDFGLPGAVVDNQGRDNGLRFVDLDKDGHDDIVLANDHQSGVYIYDSAKRRFQPATGVKVKIPSIVREGKNYGAWFARDSMWVQNETTNRLPDGVDRRSFADLLGTTDPNPKTPQDSHGSIRVRPGFTVELVVSEPLVQDPIALDWGPDGKLWVVEMADYPLGLDDRGKPGGRVRFLEDTNSDGRYDKSTVFLDGIAYPTGVMAWRDGVLVSAAPSVFFAKDTDGDGKADVRENLFRGFGEGNQQHRVNGFEWGLDNWLYLANGDSGGEIESVKSLNPANVSRKPTGDRKRLNIRGRDLRVRPDTGEMEPQAGQTQFGRHRDDHGNWFGCSNPIPVRHYVLADHYLRRNPHFAPPASRRDLARVDNAQLFPISRVLSHWSGYRPPQPGEPHKFTSACSTSIYRDTLFGPEFAQNTFTCEPVHNAVHRRVLRPDGVSFQSVRPDDETDREFLASSDSWFRPTTVTTGPDGALWVVDMYRLVIEHPQWIDDQREKELFLRAGHDRGRIYRIYPTDQPPRPIASLGKLTDAELVKALDTPNGRQRDRAQQLLIHRKALDSAPALRALMRESKNPLARLHCLCTLEGLGAVDSKIIQAGLADSHPTVRRHAVRVAEPLLRSPDVEVLKDALGKLATDADPQVRLQLAYSAAYLEDSAALLAQLAATADDDPYQRAAIFSSLNKDNLPKFYAAVAALTVHGAYREGVLQMASRMKDRQLTLEILRELLSTLEVDDPSTADLLSISEAVSAFRDAKALDQDAAGRLLQLAKATTALAANPKEEEPKRIAAIRFIGAVAFLDKQTSLAMAELVDSRHGVAIQRAAIEAIATADAESAFDSILGQLNELSPTISSTLVDRAVSRPNWTARLLEHLQSHKEQATLIGPLHRQILLSHADKKLRSQAESLFHGATSSERKEVVARYEKSISDGGDTTAGRALFRKHCAACHRLEDMGHAVGPDLRTLKNRSPQALLTAMLDPNRAVEDKYRSYNVLTEDGVRETGVIVEENSNNVTLRMAEGKTKSILRADIERIQSSGKSLMPEGLEKELSVKAMSDLLAFLGQLGPAPKAFAGNRPKPVAANNGVLKLAATHARIYGPSVVYEPKHKNLGFWANENDLAQWTVTVPATGRYEIWLDYACADNTAGSNFAVTVANQQVTGNIFGTGSWEMYRQVKVGELQLKEGTAEVSFSSAGKLKTSYLTDLRAVELRLKK